MNYFLVYLFLMLGLPFLEKKMLLCCGEINPFYFDF